MSERPEFTEGLNPETSEMILRSGFTQLFTDMFIADLYFPGGIENINDPEFFGEIYEKHLLTLYLYSDNKWKKRILNSLEYYSNVTFAEITHLWEGQIPPFTLHEDQWREFLTNIFDRLSLIE